MARWRGPGLTARLSAASAAVVALTLAGTFWGVDREIETRLRAGIEAELRTQVREWRTFSRPRRLDTPARLETAATEWLAQQGEHPSTQVQVIDVAGGRMLTSDEGLLAHEMAREQAEQSQPAAANPQGPAAGLLDAPQGSSCAWSSLTGPMLVVTEPITWQGRVVGVLRVAGSLAPVSRARAELRRTFAVFGVVAVLVAAVAAGGLALLVGRPLRRLTRLAASVDSGDSDRRMAVSRGPREVVALGNSIDQMLDRLRAAFDHQREFARDVVHELRAPLTLVRAQLGQLPRPGEPGPATSGSPGGADPRPPDPAVVRALGHLDTVDRLVADLFVLARSQTEQLGPLHPVAVADLLADLRRDLPLLGDRRYRVTGCRGTIPVDPERISQVLANLAGNAVHHTEPGGQITVTAQGRSGWLRLTVADDGPGIEPNDLDQVFERYHRAARAGEPTGLGLGLAIARALVQAHAGRIWAESEVGKGTRIHLELPGYRP